MQISELTQWVREALAQQSFPTDQNAGTTFSWRLVLRALQARIGQREATLCSLYGRAPGRVGREQMAQTYWISAVPRRDVVEREVMLDFTVFQRQPRRDVILTAESEMYGQHRTSEDGDYAWDFYKLLVVRSPIRLFICRINGDAERRDELVETLTSMIRTYSDTYLLGNDEIGVVILPTSQFAVDDVRLLVFNEGIEAYRLGDIPQPANPQSREQSRSEERTASFPVST